MHISTVKHNKHLVGKKKGHFLFVFSLLRSMNKLYCTLADIKEYSQDANAVRHKSVCEA